MKTQRGSERFVKDRSAKKNANTKPEKTVSVNSEKNRNAEMKRRDVNIFSERRKKNVKEKNSDANNYSKEARLI